MKANRKYTYRKYLNRRNEHILFILQVKFTSELTVAFKGAFVTLKHKFGRAIVIKKKKKLEREKLCLKIDDNKFRNFFFRLEDRTVTL